MEDLSSLTTSLSDILTAGGSEDSFTRIVEGHLRSKDEQVQLLTLEILHEVITEGSEIELEARRTLVFQNTALTYVPLLLPLRSHSPSTVRDILRICMGACSPREGVLALNEASQTIEEQAERFEVSEGEDEENGDPMRDNDGPDLDSLLDDVILVLELYSIVIARMPATKSTPTLLALSDAVTPLLSRFSPEASVAQSAAVLRWACAFVRAARDWVACSSDVGGEQRAILSQLLYRTIALYSNDPSNLANLHRWFLATYPRYTALHPPASSSSRPPALSDHLASAAEVLTSMSITLDDLTGMLSSQHPASGRFSPFTTLAALHIVGSALAHHRDGSDGDAAKLSLPLLDEMMVVILSGLGGSAVDAAAVVLWEAIYRTPTGSLDVDTASPLIENLMPLTAGHPDPLSRLAFLKLIQEIITRAVPGTDQILLLQQILEPANPFDTLRPQGLSILRDLLHSSSAPTIDPKRPSSTVTASTNGNSSTIFDPSLLSHLPLIPSLPDLDLQSTGDEFLFGPQGTFFTDQLATLRVLIELDGANRTGVRSAERTSEIRAGIEGVKGKIEEMRSSLGLKKSAGGEEVIGNGEVAGERAKEGARANFLLMRLEEAVERLEASLSSLGAVEG